LYPSYPSPEESQPHAKLHIVWSQMPNVMFGGTQMLYAFDTACQPDAQAKSLGVVADKIGFDKERLVRLQGGKELVIRVRGVGSALAPSYSCGAQTCISTPECTNFLSFKPEAGRTYRIQQITDGAQGTTLLTDTSANRPAPSLRRYAASELACRK